MKGLQDHGAAHVKVHKLSSGQIYIYTDYQDFKALFAYADDRWAKVFDKQFYSPTSTAWKDMATERTSFLLAAGAGGRRAAMITWVDAANPSSDLKLSAAVEAEVKKHANALPKTWPLKVDVGGVNRYNRKFDNVVNVNKSPYDGVNKVENFLYIYATRVATALGSAGSSDYTWSENTPIDQTWAAQMMAITKPGANISLYSTPEGIKDYETAFNKAAKTLGYTVIFTNKGDDLGQGGRRLIVDFKK